MTTVVVDPRMRQRRMEVSRTRGRRQRRRLLWLAVPVVLVAVLAAVAQTPLLDVDRVTVEGAGQTPRRAIIEASQISHGDSMAGLDEAAAERRVAELPWVADANAVREWPGTVRITVSERTPVAVVAAGQGGWATVDATGRVLHVGEDPHQPLVRIPGVSATPVEGEELPAETHAALRVAQTADARLRGLLASLTVDLVGELRDPDTGAVASVAFGSADELDEKVAALSAIVSQVDLGCLRLVNLEVPSAPVTEPKGC